MPEQEVVAWTVHDVARKLQVSEQLAAQIMRESGCLLPFARRKLVLRDAFLDYLENWKEGTHDA